MSQLGLNLFLIIYNAITHQAGDPTRAISIQVLGVHSLWSNNKHVVGSYQTTCLLFDRIKQALLCPKHFECKVCEDVRQATIYGCKEKGH